MFDPAWSEIALLGAVAMVAVGPRGMLAAAHDVGARTARLPSRMQEFMDGWIETTRRLESEEQLFRPQRPDRSEDRAPSWWTIALALVGASLLAAASV